MIALALAAILAAEYHYIVPIIGSTPGHGGAASHFATATMLNTSARPATVRRTGLYPADCPMPESWLIAPQARLELDYGLSSSCRRLAALSIVSDEPLSVSGTIYTNGFFPHYVADRQYYEAPSGWIEADVDATVEAQIDGGRANLLVVNPSPVPLRVQVRLYRPEFDASRDDTFEVPPATLRIFPLRSVERPREGGPNAVSGIHFVLVRADGRFQAGVSSLNNDGGNVFRRAIPLE